MSERIPRVSHLLGPALMLAVAFSCAADRLPRVPAFDQLGFDDVLDSVHRQVLSAYEAWQEKPRDADRNGRLGMLLSVYRRDTEAEILFRRARILAPEEFRWAYYLAIVLDQLGRHEEAVAAFRAALEIDPDYAEARIQLADVLLQINDLENSTELFREISEEFPARVEGWLGLGKALGRAGDYEAAILALERARLRGPQYGEVHYALATVLRASGDQQGAEREFAAYERTAKNKIRVLDPLVREVLALHAGDGPHMAGADQHLRYGRLEQAVTSFRTALAINPGNQDAWGGLIYAQTRLGAMDQAADTYRAALAAGISYARLHLTYGRALLEAQQPDAARDVIARAIELDPQFAEALSLMGELEMQSGSSAIAVDHFRRALAAQPNDRKIALSLAQALNAAGEFGEAASRLEPLSADPDIDMWPVLRELALAYHGIEREDEAIDTLRRARGAAERSADRATLNEIDALLAEWHHE